MRATDAAGNGGGQSAPRIFSVDTTAPGTTITAGPAGTTSDATPTFSLSTDEAGSTFECRVDGAGWAPCASPHTTGALANGTHTLEARATDGVGNVDATPAAWAFSVDTTAPQTTVASGPSGLTNDATPTFTFTADEPGSTFECRIDGGGWAACASPDDVPALADGTHTFEVRAVDAVGNADATPASRSITVDTDAPETTITAGPSGPTNDDTPTFALTAGEAASTFECRVDSGAWQACASPVTIPPLAAGSHTFESRASDLAGNVDPTPASHTVVVDTTAPDTTITGPPAGPTSDDTPTFAFTADEPGSTFECRVDGGAWAPCTSPLTTPPLADGSHGVEVRATDPAGNVEPSPASRAVLVDTVAPATTITSGPSPTTNDATPTFAFTADEPGSTFECRADGGAWTACSSPRTLGAPGDGDHTFGVRAIDPTGNTDPTPDSRTFTVDTRAPDTTIIAGPTGSTNDATPTFAFTSDDTGASFECRVDGGAWAPCASPQTTATLAEGEHVFEARALDAAGNADPTPDGRTVTVDTLAPATSIETGPSGPTTDATPTFAFSSDEPGASFECRVDGDAWAACASPDATGALADGDHAFEVRATDPAGNTDATPAVRTFTIDTASPGTAIIAAPASPTADATPTFAFTADEPGSTFECRLDGGPWAACASPDDLPTLADGGHTFEVRAIDTAGTPDPTPAAHAFDVDTNAPQTTLTAGPAGPMANATPTFAFEADEAGSSFECRVDAGAWAPCSSPETTSALGDGDRTFDVRAIDPAGNADPSPASWAFTVDSTTPQTTITSGPPAATDDPTPTFALATDEPGSSFECRVDGGVWETCASPVTTAALADGSHTFETRAVDAVGNADATPAARTFLVDGAAPETTISAGPEGPTADATPTVAFEADEADSTFECRLDGATWTACASPDTTTTLDDGDHVLEVRATDPAGNTDATPATLSFAVDTRAPATTVESGPSGPTNDPTPAFAFASDEPGASFECRTDGGSWASCDAPYTTPPLTAGGHTFEVRAVDAAGNADPTPVVRTFSVDTTAPDTSITAAPASPTNDATPTLAFAAGEAGASFECRVDGGPWAPCASPDTTATLADGTHELDVRAIDAAGNADPTPAIQDVTVDTTAPDTAITTGAAGPAPDATPSFAFTADEGGATFECRVDDGAWAPCSAPLTTAPLDDGDHSFAVRATDPAGSTDPTPAVQTFTIDTGQPQTTITAGPSGPTSDAAPTWAFTADEPGATFACRVDAGAWSACTPPQATVTLPAGVHTFAVRAIDAAGNVDASPAQRTVTIDTHPPDTIVTDGPTGPIADPTPAYEFTADEPGVRFECRVDLDAWAACESPHTTALLDNGEHTLEVRAIDAAGNPDPLPAVRTFTVARETTPPDTQIDGPSGLTDDPTPTFALSATEPGATFECRLDGGAWEACPSSMTTVALADRDHTFEARATDAAGNTDPTPATRAFTVMTARAETPQPAPAPAAPAAGRIGPSVAVTGAPRDGDPVPAYTFAASEDGATFLCRIDDGAFVPCTARFALPGDLTEGEHALEVLAVDRAGNLGTSVHMTFFVGAGCAGTNGFRSASPRGSGRALAIRFVPRVDVPVRADIFQVSLGHTLLRERLIARYRGLKRSRTWPGRADARGRRIGDGYYVVRLSIPLGPGRVDTRRLVAQRVRGRWVPRPGYYGRSICGLIAAYKLERPVFGGAARGPARISFRLAQPARVTVDVLRGRTVVKRLGGMNYPVRRTIRLTLPARWLRPGVYRFRLTAVGESRRATVEASARRL